MLIGIIGNMGSGKTLGAVYLGWRQHNYKEIKLYSNIHLYGLPYYYVDSIPDIDAIHDGFFLADELWVWIGALTFGVGSKVKKKFAGDILMKSRKRGLIIAYTSQTMDQIDPRIRRVTDFYATPVLLPNNILCRLMLFRGSSRIKMENYLRTFRFNPFPLFEMFNTNEEIPPLKARDMVCNDCSFEFEEPEIIRDKLDSVVLSEKVVCPRCKGENIGNCEMKLINEPLEKNPVINMKVQ